MTVGIEGAVHGGGQCGYGQGYCMWRSQSKKLREMAPARHSSGSERFEDGSEFWNLSTCAVKKINKLKVRHAV